MADPIEEIGKRLFGIKDIKHKIGISRLKNVARFIPKDRLINWYVNLFQYPGQEANRKQLLKVIQERKDE